MTKNYQMAIKYVYLHCPFQGPLKYIQTGIFDMKIYHLATLAATAAAERNPATALSGH
jgi:hypothetical protein